MNITLKSLPGTVLHPWPWSMGMVFYARWTIILLSLLGIGLLLWFYVNQNSLLAGAYQELAAREQSAAPLTPVELADLAHRACVLDTGINNVQSFLQPLSSTLSRGGWCGNYVRVFISFAQQEGYPAHKFHLQSGGRSHTLAEVYYQGKWRIIDPFLNYAYLLPNGEMATYQDLRQDLSLVANPTQGSVKDPRLERIYRGYEPIFPLLYRDAADFYLKFDRSAIYHNIFVTLSYPLSPFYEGGRRPILPSWLDRPELLGIYFLSLVVLTMLAPAAARAGGKLRRRFAVGVYSRSKHSP